MVSGCKISSTIFSKVERKGRERCEAAGYGGQGICGAEPDRSTLKHPASGRAGKDSPLPAGLTVYEYDVDTDPAAVRRDTVPTVILSIIWPV